MIYNTFTSLCRFFFNDTATTEIYTLSLHDALPISLSRVLLAVEGVTGAEVEQSRRLLSEAEEQFIDDGEDRKSTRLNSSHVEISYAVFCLKKKNNNR